MARNSVIAKPEPVAVELGTSWQKKHLQPQFPFAHPTKAWQPRACLVIPMWNLQHHYILCCGTYVELRIVFLEYRRRLG